MAKIVTKASLLTALRAAVAQSKAQKGARVVPVHPCFDGLPFEVKFYTIITSRRFGTVAQSMQLILDGNIQWSIPLSDLDSLCSHAANRVNQGKFPVTVYVPADDLGSPWKRINN